MQPQLWALLATTFGKHFAMGYAISHTTTVTTDADGVLALLSGKLTEAQW